MLFYNFIVNCAIEKKIKLIHHIIVWFFVLSLSKITSQQNDSVLLENSVLLLL